MATAVRGDEDSKGRKGSFVACGVQADWLVEEDEKELTSIRQFRPEDSTARPKLLATAPSQLLSERRDQDAAALSPNRAGEGKGKPAHLDERTPTTLKPQELPPL